jgi:predicted MFS family arabinose efflux permease
LYLSDLSILQNRNFLWLWAAGGMSNASRWMETGVLGWLILDLTDSAWYVALVGVSRSAPLLAFGLFAGLIADRTNRWVVMLCAQAINALMTGVLLVLLLFEAIQPWHVLLVAFILGCDTILDMPSRRSLIYDLVGPQQVVSAMSLETINNTVGKFLGPLIGGLMLEMTGFAGVYLLLAVIYLLALGLILQVRINLPAPAASAQPIWQSLLSGIQYALHNRVVLGVLCITVIMNALAFSYQQILPVMARDHLGVGPGLMGLLASADGLGTLIGALLLAALGNQPQHGRIFALGALLELVCLLAFAASPWYALSLALLLGVGLGNAGFSTMQSTIILLSAAPGMRGRAVGILGLCIGSTPLGLLELGAVAAAVGVPVAIGFNAGLGLVLWLSIIAFTPLLSGFQKPQDASSSSALAQGRVEVRTDPPSPSPESPSRPGAGGI